MDWASDREWMERTLAHQADEAVPYNFLFSPPAERLAQEHYGQDLEECLSLPIRMTAPASVKPLYADPDAYGETITDEFGVVWSTSKIDRGSPIGPCLPEPDLSHYTFPDPAQSYRFRDIAEWCVRQAGHYRVIW
jgi:hypothetical protein